MTANDQGTAINNQSQGLTLCLLWALVYMFAHVSRLSAAVDEEIKETDLPQTTRNTHAVCVRVCQPPIFSAPLQPSISLYISPLYSYNSPCVLSTAPYQPMH